MPAENSTSLNQNIRSKLFSVGLLLVAIILIQMSSPLAKQFFPLIGAEGTTTLRLFFAALIMVLIMRPWRATHTASSLRFVILYGLALGGMNLFFYLCINRIPLGIGVALEFMGPLAVAVWSSRRLIDFCWIILAVLGLYLLVPIGNAVHSLDPVGVMYGLGGGTCWALYIIFGKQVGPHYGTQGVAIGLIVATLLVLPFGIAKAGIALFDPSIIPLAIVLSLLSMALPYSLEMVALTRLPASTFGILMSIEPVVATFSGLLFLDEKLTLLQWIAIAAIVLASAGTTLSHQKQQ